MHFNHATTNPEIQDRLTMLPIVACILNSFIQTTLGFLLVGPQKIRLVNQKDHAVWPKVLVNDLLNGDFVFGNGVVFFSGFEDGGWKRRLVG